jgi:transposase
LAIRSFLRLPVDESPPDHTTISRTRRIIDLESHRAVFTWVQQRLVTAGLLKGKTVAVDATLLEANAAMRSIVRRDTGESYQEFLTGLAQASGIATPTRGSGAPGPQAQEENLERRLEISGGSRREDREDERWPDAPGLQS